MLGLTCQPFCKHCQKSPRSGTKTSHPDFIYNRNCEPIQLATLCARLDRKSVHMKLFLCCAPLQFSVFCLTASREVAHRFFQTVMIRTYIYECVSNIVRRLMNQMFQQCIQRLRIYICLYNEMCSPLALQASFQKAITRQSETIASETTGWIIIDFLYFLFLALACALLGSSLADANGKQDMVQPLD